MQTLIDAARAGKEVTVVVELMARFDEEANINWAAKLEEVGAHVVYGVVGHKTHAKMALVVRREEGRLMRYVHLGTGNYHPRTARLYTDFDLLTSHAEICADVNEVFQQLTGLGQGLEAVATSGRRRSRCTSACSRRSRTRRGTRAPASPAASCAKMNALLEPVGDRGALQGLPGGREGRSPGARRVRAAPGRAQALGEHPRALDRRALPRAHARLPLRQRRRTSRSGCRARTGWTAISSAASSSAFPVLDREARAAHRARGAEALPRRQHAVLGHATRRDLRAPQARARQEALRAARAAGAGSPGASPATRTATSSVRFLPSFAMGSAG